VFRKQEATANSDPHASDFATVLENDRCPEEYRNNLVAFNNKDMKRNCITKLPLVQKCTKL
jgi:hypothetical protein